MSTCEVFSVADACADLACDVERAADLRAEAEGVVERRSEWLAGDARFGVPYEFRSAVPTAPLAREWVSEVFRDAVRSASGSVATIGRGNSLLLQGPLGTGKTYEAVGVARALALGGLAGHIRIVSTVDYYGLMRPGGEGEQAFALLANAALLVLDDVGAARDSAWTEELDYRLIDARYREQRRTVITSNYARVGYQKKDERGRAVGAYVPSFEERVGARIASRLERMCVRVAVKGEDRRRTGAVA